MTDIFFSTGGQWFEAGNVSPTGPMASVGESLWICPQGGVPPAVSLCSYTLTVQPGYNLIANQCSDDRRVATLLPGVPEGTQLIKYDNRTGRYGLR